MDAWIALAAVFGLLLMIAVIRDMKVMRRNKALRAEAGRLRQYSLDVNLDLSQRCKGYARDLGQRHPGGYEEDGE